MTVLNWLWDVQGGITLGIIWAIMALGLYLTYRVLNYADLTVDGSLALGGAISAVLVANDMNPFLAVFIAMIGGMLAGLVTGLLHTKLKNNGQGKLWSSQRDYYLYTCKGLRCSFKMGGTFSRACVCSNTCQRNILFLRYRSRLCIKSDRK